MLRILASLALHLIANAVGLLVAAILLTKFSINGLAFVVAVLVFSLTEVIAEPLLTKIALKSLPALRGGVALVTSLVGLIITSIFTDGIQVTGLATWFLAALIIWVFALLASVILPLFLFKKTLGHVKKDA